MLTIEDVLALSELTPEEVRAIAAHEHLPEIIAAELGNYLVHQPDGTVRLRRMIIDDIEEARAAGHMEDVLKYKAILKHFIEMHPESMRSG